MLITRYTNDITVRHAKKGHVENVQRYNLLVNMNNQIAVMEATTRTNPAERYRHSLRIELYPYGIELVVMEALEKAAIIAYKEDPNQIQLVIWMLLV